MEYPNCSLINASPVNNGPAAIYQTTVQGHNGQPTDIFSSGMQYPRKCHTHYFYALLSLFLAKYTDEFFSSL